jgi:nucleoside-diphosphate-sugar epimerase/pimeloyl-ACP methyl ester carboxylesterase
MLSAIVTGGTGFLGSHFIVKFAGRKFGKIYAVVRGESDEVCEKKLRDALGRAIGSYYSETRDVDAILRCVQIVRGDISADGLGVDASLAAHLRSCKIDGFWHFAASLNYEDYKREHIKSTNVDGAVNALNFAKNLGIDNFVYVSTAYTCGSKDGVIDEVLHPLEGPFSNFYEESKCHAEHALTSQCARSSMNLTILRPSVVVGNSETFRPGGSDSGVYGFIREIRRLQRALSGTQDNVRLFGAPSGEVNVIPINLLMKDVSEIIDGGLSQGGIYHLCSTSCPTNGFVLDSICKKIGVSNLHFESRAEGGLSPLERMLEKRTVFYSNYLNAKKFFSRRIKGEHEISESEMVAYIIEGVKAAAKQSVDDVFRRSHVETSDGVRLSVYEVGDASNTCVLICNAFGMPVEFVRPMAEELSREYRVVTWDTRLLPGSSNDPVGIDVSLTRHVQDACEIMKRLKIDKAMVVGWCAGARVALKLSSSNAHRVLGVALLNGSYSTKNLPQTRFEQTMSLVMPRISSDYEYAKVFHRSIYSVGEASSETEGGIAQRRSHELLTSTNPDFLHLTSIPFSNYDNLYRYAKLIKALIDEPMVDSDFEVQVPTLVLTASSDVTAHPAASKKVSEWIAGAAFTSVEGGDHFSLYSNERCRKAILSFVTDVINDAAVL